MSASTVSCATEGDGRESSQDLYLSAELYFHASFARPWLIEIPGLRAYVLKPSVFRGCCLQNLEGVNSRGGHLGSIGADSYTG